MRLVWADKVHLGKASTVLDLDLDLCELKGYPYRADHVVAGIDISLVQIPCPLGRTRISPVLFRRQ